VEKVLEIARSRGVPVVNTHTGCFELNNDKGYERNTKEDHAFEIAQTGGLLGVYVAPMFLGKTPPIVAPSELVAVHIDRLIKTIEKKAKEKGLNLKGVEHVAIGTDYDGAIDIHGAIDIPDDQTDCRDFVKVTYYLLRMGYTEADLERIYRTNFLRAWKTIWNAKTKTP